MHPSLKNSLLVLRRTAGALVGRDLFVRRQVVLPTEMIGDGYGAWTVYPRPFTPDSVVYSFGVGEDVSFDLALIARYGVQVHAFDPTPRSKAWIERQALPERFTFHAFGVAGFDGTATFNAPADPTHVSYTMAERQAGDATQTVEAPVYRLATILDRLGHDHIDLLKIDVEGAEYDVLDDLVTSGVDVRQLLVEFHHRFAYIGLPRTRTAIRQLNRHGYRIFHVAPRGEEIAFVRE